MRLVGGESLPGGVYFVDGKRCALALEGPRGVEVEVWAAPFPQLPRPLLSFAALAYALAQHVRAYRRVMERVAKGGEGERPLNALEVGLALFLTLLNTGLLLGLVLLARTGAGALYPLLGKTLVHLLPFLVLLLALRLLLAAMGGDALRKHAAEHQVIHLVERGLPLTPDGARAMPVLHPRCGFNALGIGGLLFVLLGLYLPVWLALPLALLLAYEAAAIPWLAPLGYPVQRLFLASPREKDLEVALRAARALLEEGVSG